MQRKSPGSGVDYSRVKYVKRSQSNVLQCEMLCRAKNNNVGGVVDKSTGLCELPVSEKSLEEYQIHLSGHKGQFKWYNKDESACHLWFRSSTEESQVGDWSNCNAYGDRYCRFPKNSSFVLGVVDSNKLTCVSSGNESSSSYQLYQLELPAYHNYGNAVFMLFLVGSFVTVMTATSFCME